MKRTRVVLIVTPSSRLLGARRSLLALAESLDPARWRPVVCGQDFGQLGEALAERGIRMETVKLGWWRKGKYFLWRPFAIARLAALARTVGADLIHCNEIYPHPYAIRAAGHVLGPEGSPCEGQAIPVVTHVRLGIRPDMIHKYDLHRADQLVVPSRSMLGDFESMEDRRTRVRVIYNGVNLTEYSRVRPVEVARRQIGLPEGGLLLAAIGQVGPRKGGDIVLEAFARIAADHPEARLMFVGDTHRGQEPFAERLKARASVAPLAGRVFFFPFTPDILPYYESADINLLISRDEAFGRTVIEAGAVGIPTIGSAVGGIAEIIVDGVTGRLVPPDDAPSLEAALRQLLGNESLRKDLAEAAFRRAAQNFSIEAHTNQMMDLYDEVLESKAML